MARDRKFLLATLSVFTASLAVYLRTLYPSVPGGDSGELITVAYKLEVAHPPGYPLYTLLAHLFTWLPFGSIAWRVNLLSAVCDAGAAAVICAALLTATGSIAAAILGAALFPLSPLIWTYAVGAEVFPLNNLFAALLFYLALAWHRTRDARLLYAIAAVAGLGLTNHQTLAFYVLPLAAWLAWQGGTEVLSPPRVAGLVATGAAALSLYAYLWLAAADATTVSWGDASSWRGFVDHVLRRDYGTFQLAAGDSPPPSLAMHLASYGAHAARATMGVGAILAVIGAVVSIGGVRARPHTSSTLRSSGDENTARSWAVLLLGSYVFYLLVFFSLANLPLDDPLRAAVLARFWQQADVILFLFVGLGLAAVGGYLPANCRAVIGIAAVALPLARLQLSFHAQNQSSNETVARYGRALLEPLPRNALLLTKGDVVTNVTRYLQTCDGIRGDVIVLDQELMTKPWYVRRAAAQFTDVHFPGDRYHPAEPRGFSMRQFLDANSDHAVYLYPEWKPGDPSIEDSYEAWPMGLASKVEAANAATSVEQWARESADAIAKLDHYEWPALERFDEGSWERVVLDDVWQAHHRRGWWLLTKALQSGADRQLLEAARASLEAARRAHPSPPWYVYKNLGIAYDGLAAAAATAAPAESAGESPLERLRAQSSGANATRKLRALQLSLWSRYLELAPASDPQRGPIAQAVAQLRTELAKTATPAEKEKGESRPSITETR